MSARPFGSPIHKARRRAFDERQLPREIALKNDVAEWGRRLEQSVLAKFDKQKAWRATKATPQALLFDVDAKGEELWKIVRGAAVKAAQAEGNAKLAEIIVHMPSAEGLQFSADNPEVAAYLEEKALKVKTVVTDLHGQLRDILVSSEREGLTLDEVRNLLTDRFEGLQDWQAERIARTEIIGAANTGAHAAIGEVGAKEEWVAVLDDRTRDSHAEMNGEVVDVGEEFSNGLLYPGDPNGEAAEVINCRCSLAGVFDGMEGE